MTEHPRARSTPPRALRLEVLLVVLVSAGVLVPGIWRYSLTDPWETHYGEVARTMLQDRDFVHTKWVGTYYSNPGDNEGFRSKPVLTFWLMAAGLQAMGVGDHGGYSGEMTQDSRTMTGIRLPFVLCAIAGLTLMWWMLARLVSRRLAWLALLVVGSTPMFCMIARIAIPDMPMVACTIGALALFTMAVEDGDRPISILGHVRGFAIDARHVVLGLAGGFVLAQAAYYAFYFVASPQLAVRGPMPSPALWIPALMLLLFGGLSRDGWLIVRLPMVLLGGVIAAIVHEPMPRRRPGQRGWRHVFDDVLGPWERHALDRYLIRAIVFPAGWASGGGWAATSRLADRVLGMAPLATMRQLYLLGCYFLLGVSLLAKGPPGVTIVAGVGAFYVILLGRWRELWEGAFEIKRGLLMMSVVAVFWHVAMFLKDGPQFVSHYLYTHILNRAAQGVDDSPGTFAYYTDQLGHGMWLWAALLPAALAVAFARAHRETREGRVRFVVGIWAIVAVFLFCFVQTKFHHYILPALPPLGLLVAFFLDDLIARRERLHPAFAALAIGIVLLVCRDLMFEPDRWVDMFVFLYQRPWPSAEPWAIDPSDGFLGLGVFAALGIAVAATRFVRIGVALIAGAGLAICLWSLHIYMPHAGTHWGMREAMRTYYEQRTIYGHKTVVFGAGQCVDELRGTGEVWSFETFIPETLHPGQPMTITLQVNQGSQHRVTDVELAVHGEVTQIGHHDVTVRLFPGEHAKVEQLVAGCERRVADHGRALAAYRTASAADRKAGKVKPPDRLRGRPPVRAVDADRLIAWQLYWRGENFWSGGEIWAWLPEMKTSLYPVNNVAFLKYLNDRELAPIGRRYFIITTAARANHGRSVLPTQRAKDSYEVIDTTSNKFSLAAFYL